MKSLQCFFVLCECLIYNTGMTVRKVSGEPEYILNTDLHGFNVCVSVRLRCDSSFVLAGKAQVSLVTMALLLLWVSMKNTDHETEAAQWNSDLHLCFSYMSKCAMSKKKAWWRKSTQSLKMFLLISALFFLFKILRYFCFSQDFWFGDLFNTFTFMHLFLFCYDFAHQTIPFHRSTFFSHLLPFNCWLTQRQTCEVLSSHHWHPVWFYHMCLGWNVLILICCVHIQMTSLIFCLCFHMFMSL